MALLEAVVVVYLRGLLQISPEYVSLGPYLRMELLREVATLTMLSAVGWLAGQRRRDRLAFGLFSFALWDIWYYVWLRALIGWPATLLDWDILFLIPLRWWSPVLAPLLIASLICTCAFLAVIRMERAKPLSFTPARVAFIALGASLALYVFVSDSLHALIRGQLDWAVVRPGPFNWPLFLVALALMALPSLAATWPGRIAHTRAAESRS
jgi:hypothetical protein